ncbi:MULTISPECIES: DotU family type IV/VI secretion system protein [Enterobacteriaceae]|uniref:DotU family type IV/VI secretion system protein n=1 Tax=Enterobacteriaceae TaxID=543 RepID=UPI000BE20E69|nr:MULTISPECIES: DotU family type IV/VI secretion system protein [Enterobacteriaceae]EBB6210879.1 DotU family type IV/VI secretion system protein [Salmonella enterica]EBM0756957.1 DotU family type IV/VI secretion system protein [Salmonella enterica subsp. enterica serovar Muenchen]EBZ4664584.1 DotU family type IV/VI secretion system protein [Salmonella enterica subsp. enterica serovar Bovismorbificans]ECH8729566.1 DotU family type IV/VI secretion system protein [Salmonella enterica subsp. enter
MALLDDYLPLISHTIIALEDPETSAVSLRQTLIQLRDTVYHLNSQGNNSRQDVRSACSAIFICLDEIILCSGHRMAEDWHQRPLQKEIHGNSLGGIHFFQQLEEISDNNDELRVVYLFCLFVGYKGRYITEDHHVLDDIIDRHVQKLPGEYAQSLYNGKTPAWNSRPPVTNTRKKKLSLRLLIVLAVSITYLIMNLLLII